MYFSDKLEESFVVYLIIHTVKNKRLSKRIYNLDLIANFSFFNKTWETWLFVSSLEITKLISKDHGKSQK